MPTTKTESTKREAALRPVEFIDRVMGDWPDFFRRPAMFWSEREAVPMRVEEFTENGVLVMRVEIGGIDPDKDVDIEVDHDLLRVTARRHEEHETSGRDYLRREFRYGTFVREMPLPHGVSESEITASYADGILKVRVPEPAPAASGTTRIAVSKG